MHGRRFVLLMPGCGLWIPAIPLIQSNRFRIEKYAGPVWKFCPDGPPFGSRVPENAARIRNEKSASIPKRGFSTYARIGLPPKSTSLPVR